MIVVVGGTGNIGTEVVKLLVERGQPVRALVRDVEKGRQLLPASVELVQGDLGKPETLGAAFAGAERVFMVTPPSPTLAEHQLGAVKAARAAGVKQLVKVSVRGASPASPISLGRMHGEVDEALAASGLNHVSLQPSSFMQNFLRNAGTVQGQGAIFAPTGDGKATFVDVRDVAEAAVAVLTSPLDKHAGKRYVLCGPAAVSYAEVAAAIGRAIGKEVKHVNVPPEAARAAMLGAGIPEWLVEDMLKMLAGLAAGLASAGNDDFQQITGHAPRSIEDFARDNARVFAGEPATV